MSNKKVTYFVSYYFTRYNDSNGWGNIHISLTDPITTYDHIVSVTDWIKLEYDLRECVIISYSRLT
jgi:hypothetical protein